MYNYGFHAKDGLYFLRTTDSSDCIIIRKFTHGQLDFSTILDTDT